MKRIIECLIFAIVIVGLPILVSTIAELIADIITIEFVMKCVFLATGLGIIYILKEV